MRVVLEVLLLGTVLAFAVAYGPILWRRVKARKPRVRPASLPVLPERSRSLALLDERLSEAVQIRDNIAGYARRADVGLDVALVAEVDALIGGLVALFETGRELDRHLAQISEERLARDAAVLDSRAIAAQRRQLEGLRARHQALEAELARAVSGLRQAWLTLLDALAQPGGGALAGAQTRAQVEALTLRVAAEREAREVASEVETA